jgi:hypothetical protein
MSSGWVGLIRMDDETQWLSPAEQHAWRTFIRLHQRLTATLTRDLQAQSKLSGAALAHVSGRILEQLE